jgi:menaquinone-dependent protoporphyrinogen IX oxidase
LVRVFVVYDTKYGNTKLVAEKIVEGLGEVKGIETAISDVEEVNLEKVADYDAILIGGQIIGADPLGQLVSLLTSLAS